MFWKKAAKLLMLCLSFDYFSMQEPSTHTETDVFQYSCWQIGRFASTCFNQVATTPLDCAKEQKKYSVSVSSTKTSDALQADANSLSSSHSFSQASGPGAGVKIRGSGCAGSNLYQSMAFCCCRCDVSSLSWDSVYSIQNSCWFEESWAAQRILVSWISWFQQWFVYRNHARARWRCIWPHYCLCIYLGNCHNQIDFQTSVQSIAECYTILSTWLWLYQVKSAQVSSSSWTLFCLQC